MSIAGGECTGEEGKRKRGRGGGGAAWENTHAQLSRTGWPSRERCLVEHVTRYQDAGVHVGGGSQRIAGRLRSPAQKVECYRGHGALTLDEHALPVCRRAHIASRALSLSGM